MDKKYKMDIFEDVELGYGRLTPPKLTRCVAGYFPHQEVDIEMGYGRLFPMKFTRSIAKYFLLQEVDIEMGFGVHKNSQ